MSVKSQLEVHLSIKKICNHINACTCIIGAILNPCISANHKAKYAILEHKTQQSSSCDEPLCQIILKVHVLESIICTCQSSTSSTLYMYA